MSEFREMEWNAKWDWENFGSYGSKAIGSPTSKKAQLGLAGDWVIVDDGSFNLSGNDGHASSAKSSISEMEGSCGNFSKNFEIKGMGFSTTSSPPPPDSSVGSLLGLKLGKRTYFENSFGGGGDGATPTPSTVIVKKSKSLCGQNGPICCQVEGCNMDLSKAKEYHRKHRVCETHSKCPRVIVGGRDRRFCQQCSRFHSLSEFDEKKRSCRRRLSDHNARRRKPQQETIHFDPTTHSTPYYGGNQGMSFVLNNNSCTLVQPRTPGNCGWDNACNSSKFTLTQGYSFKSNGTDEVKPPQGIINMQNSANGLLPSKNPTSLVSNPAAPALEFGRALSLLSSNSWDSCEPESIHHQMDSNIQAIPQGDFWLSSHPHIPTNANFQEIQLFKSPYDANLYSNILN